MKNNEILSLWNEKNIYVYQSVKYTLLHYNDNQIN